MSARQPKSDESAEISRSWLGRFERLGLRARALQGERTVIVSVSLSGRPFPGLEGPVHIPQLMLATVGRDRAKCMKPLSLFALPMLHLANCRSVDDIEARLRLAWKQHIEQLGLAYERLRDIGAEVDAKHPASVLRVPVEGEGSEVAARLVDDRHLILPGRGPLSGIALHEREDRLLHLESDLSSGSELQIAISTRLEELAERAKHEAIAHRRSNATTSLDTATARVSVRSHRLLLVGPELGRDRNLIDSLSLRGYSVESVRSATEAVRFYRACSPELVLAEADLGRSEGLDLVPMLRDLAGVEEIPVVVVDRRRHEGRRRAARAIGAAGYLVRPIDVASIADRLRIMVDEPRKRRFTRYADPIAVRVVGARGPCTATALSRGGFYLRSDEDFPAHTLHECELVLPDSGRAVRVEAEALYRLGQSGRSRRGVGLRFERFSTDGEPVFLEYLQGLESPRAR